MVVAIADSQSVDLVKGWDYFQVLGIYCNLPSRKMAPMYTPTPPGISEQIFPTEMLRFAVLFPLHASPQVSSAFMLFWFGFVFLLVIGPRKWSL